MLIDIANNKVCEKLDAMIGSSNLYVDQQSQFGSRFSLAQPIIGRRVSPAAHQLLGECVNRTNMPLPRCLRTDQPTGCHVMSAAARSGTSHVKPDVCDCAPIIMR